jgi:hypothetical protein
MGFDFSQVMSTDPIFPQRWPIQQTHEIFLDYEKITHTNFATCPQFLTQCLTYKKFGVPYLCNGSYNVH